MEIPWYLWILMGITLIIIITSITVSFMAIKNINSTEKEKPNLVTQNIKVGAMSKRKLKGWQIASLVIAILSTCAVLSVLFGTEHNYEDSKQEENETIDSSTKPDIEKKEPIKEEKPTLTVGQTNALKSAKNYINVMAFSHSGLIKQLEFENYSTEDATYAADNCEADWNQQAEKKAKEYLKTMPFSRQGLIDQLLFEGFTQAQAEHGATAAGY